VWQKLRYIPGKKIFICGKEYHSDFEGIKLLPNVGIGTQIKWMIKILRQFK